MLKKKFTTTVKRHVRHVQDLVQNRNKPCNLWSLSWSRVINVDTQTPLGVMRRQVTCDVCHGTGQEIKDPCQTCHGTGHEKQKP